MSFDEERMRKPEELRNALLACAEGDCDNCTFFEADTPRGYNPCHEWLMLTQAAEYMNRLKWIPVSEALPKDGQRVIGWCNGFIDIVNFEAGISEETRVKMRKGEIENPSQEVWCLSEGTTKIKRSELYNRSDECGNNQKPYCWVHEPMTYFGQNVNAWMPLPEPWREE